MSRNGDNQIYPRPVNPSDAFPIIFGDAIFRNTNASVIGGVYSSTESLAVGFAATTSSSVNVAGIANTATAYFGGPLLAGMQITGPGIPAGTTIATVPTANTITLSAAATTSVTTTLTAGSALLTPAGFIGIAVREVKQANQYITDGPVPIFGAYTPGQTCDSLERGSCSVLVRVTTGMAPWGQVYLRVALNPAVPAGVIGGFEAQADTGVAGYNTIALTNLQFTTGLADSNGVAEISLLTRNNA